MCGSAVVYREATNTAWLEDKSRLDEQVLSDIARKLKQLAGQSPNDPACRDMTAAVIQRFTRNWMRHDVKLPPNGRAVYRGVMMTRPVAGKVVYADVRHCLREGEHLNTTQLFEAARDIERGATALWLGDSMA